MSDLEQLAQLVRDTLVNRARTIEAGPSWQPATVSPLRPRRTWFAPLVAALVIIAVTATIVGIRQTGHDTHAAQPTVTPTPTTITSPTKTPTPAPTMATCSADLPATWRTAIATGATTAGAPSALPLAVTPDGGVLVSRDYGTGRDVALIGAAGRPRKIYTVPTPNDEQVLTGVVEGSWAMITVSRLPRDANGVIPRVVRIVLINLTTGERRVVFDQVEQDIVAGVNFVDGATLLDGRVYYDIRPRFAKPNGIVRAYDIAKGTDRIVASGPINPYVGPVLTARGVSWSTDTSAIAVARSVPVIVERTTASRRAATSLTTDGTAYAWFDQHGLFYWARGMPAPTRFDLAPPPTDAPSDLAVAGPIVLYRDGGGTQLHALDTRTGATTSLRNVQPFAMTGRGVVAAYRFTGAFKQSPTAVVRIDAAHLPELHC